MRLFLCRPVGKSLKSGRGRFLIYLIRASFSTVRLPAPGPPAGSCWLVQCPGVRCLGAFRGWTLQLECLGTADGSCFAFCFAAAHARMSVAQDAYMPSADRTGEGTGNAFYVSDRLHVA